MKLRGADVLARALAAAGTKHVFALSGNHIMPVFDAALEAQLSLVHVRHEAAAAHRQEALQISRVGIEIDKLERGACGVLDQDLVRRSSAAPPAA